MRLLCLVSLGLLVSFSLTACDGGGGEDPDAGSGGEDAAVAPVECAAAPAPLVAGTTETDALADAAARCGQAAHAWLRSDALGEVTDVGPSTRFSRRVLEGVAETEGVILPRPLDHSVVLRTIRYTTQDRGELVESTALIASPEGHPPGSERPVLLFVHGTSGFTKDCGPSADTASQLLVAVFAAFGFVVVAPDYLGLEAGGVGYDGPHPYLIGQATAIASLDAVRAALRVDPEVRADTCAPVRFATFGGSQGGHAALWVDRLAPYYARELEPLGVVATVPPADLFGQVERALIEFVSASANSAAFYATAPFWYGYGDRIDEVFTSPWDVDLPLALAAECSPSGIDDVTTLEQVFTSEILATASGGTLADADPWGCMLAENTLTRTSIARIGEDAASYGILFVTGSEDPLVHTPVERAAFTTLCEEGMPMEYLECEGASHGSGTTWALPEIVRFLEARLAGEPFSRPASCEVPAAVRCEGTP